MRVFDLNDPELPEAEIAGTLGLFLGYAPQGLYTFLLNEKGDIIASLGFSGVVMVEEEVLTPELEKRISEIAQEFLGYP